MWPDGFPSADYLRRARRRLDCSQREMAKLAGCPQSTIARFESNALQPTVVRLNSLLGLADLYLVVIDASHHYVHPLHELGGDCRDGAGRRYPAHLDVIIDPQHGQWWVTPTAWTARRRRSAAVVPSATGCGRLLGGRCAATSRTPAVSNRAGGFAIRRRGHRRLSHRCPAYHPGHQRGKT